MCDVEVGVGPLNRDPGILKLLVRLVIGPVTARPRRIELHTHLDAGILPVDDGRDQTRFGVNCLINSEV